MLRLSPAQVDRLLAPHKARLRHRGLCGTKPGGLLKHRIPIRTDNWDITRPGYLEADTVAHCGQSLEKDFIWSVTYTDIYSGWTSLRAVWNKGAEGVVEATRQVEGELPFEVPGFDCDNGSEFLNWHLIKHFQDRPRQVGFTRSRPYHKDDNGHVEQKNWTHARQLLGYQRLEDPELRKAINRLYVEFWEPLHNYFCPSAKLLQKKRHGAKVSRQHDTPHLATDCAEVSELTRQKLRRERAKLNPTKLARNIERELRRILQPPLRSSRPAGSLHSGETAAKTAVTTSVS